VGARQTIGFPRTHLREPFARLFYTTAPDPGAAVHVIFKNLALLAPVGVDDRQPRFPLVIPATPTTEFVIGHFGADHYVLVNPCAAWPNKRWPPERYGEVAFAIQRRFGLRSFVLWGPGEESIAQAVVASSSGAAEISPATTITDLFGIARGAHLMISGDTGPLHIAAAVGTPMVALFGPTWPERNGPWDPDDITLSRASQCSCLYERRCRRSAPCINDIAVADVMAAVDRRLASRG
jgi:heptosyltransferase I